MADANPPPPSEPVQLLMILVALAPVAGAMFSGPIVGGTLASLAVIDSILMMIGVAQ